MRAKELRSLMHWGREFESFLQRRCRPSYNESLDIARQHSVNPKQDPEWSSLSAVIPMTRQSAADSARAHLHTALRARRSK
jgi:hypothetical protein